MKMYEIEVTKDGDEITISQTKFETWDQNIILDKVQAEIIANTLLEMAGLKKKQVKFVPPTVEQIIAYNEDKGYTIDPENFINFYQSKGWKVGNTKMKCWKSAIRTWVKGSKSENNRKFDKRGRGEKVADKLNAAIKKDIEENGITEIVGSDAV